MSDAWLGFLGGILATLVGGLVASLIQTAHEANQKKSHAQLDAYFYLVDLKNWYFWVATAELHGEDPRPEVLENCRRLALQLNDKLRSFDGVEELEEMLSVLFSESIATAQERADRLNALIDKYGQLVNPKYSQIIGRISRENVLRHGPHATPPINAPGSWRYVK